MAVRNLPRWAGLVAVLSVPGPGVTSAQVTVNAPVPDRATLHVHADRPTGVTISRNLFGSFLEPIDNSTYGGIWAQELDNPSLEYGLWKTQYVTMKMEERPELVRASGLGLPIPWEPLDYGQGARYEQQRGAAANSFCSLVVMGLPRQTVGIKQLVYLPVHRTLRYNGSLYARHLSGDATLTVSLRPHGEDKALASAKVAATARGWKRYDFRLDLPRGGVERLAPLDFAIALGPDERVDLDQITLFPADAVDGMEPDLVELARGMHSEVLRYGGNFTSGYHWRDGVGPMDKRVSMMNLSWGIPEYNTFGTDEYLRLCERMGSTPQVCLNMGSGTPEEAADWVRYIKAHYKGKVIYELGNELFGGWQIGYPAMFQIADKTVAFAKAVRAVDPDAMLIATGNQQVGENPWNDELLKAPAGTFDLISCHYIFTTNNVKLADPTPEFYQHAAWALPIEIGRRIEHLQAQVDRVPAHAGKAHFAMTEWLYPSRSRKWFRTFNSDAPGVTNMGGAVTVGGIFNMLMRHGDIVKLADMTGMMDFFGLWKVHGQAYATPAAYTFGLYAGTDAHTLVKTDNNAGSYSVANGVDGVANVADVPYLDVCAAFNTKGDALTLFVVNRHPSKDIAAELDLAGFKAGATVDVKFMGGHAFGEVNDDVNPTRVVPQISRIAVDTGHPSHTFPHGSVTILTFHKG